MTKTSPPPGARVLATGKYLTMVSDAGWEYVTRPHVSGIVVIVPLTPDGHLVLVEQLRRAVQNRVVELPAGMVGDAETTRGESLADAARRELIEETGYEAGEMTPLGEGPIAVGVSDEVVTFFQARDLRKVGPGGGDDSEDIVVHEVAPADLRAFVTSKQQAGLGVDPKIYAGLYLAGIGGPAAAQAGSAAFPPMSHPLALDQPYGPLGFVARESGASSATWEYKVDRAHFNPNGVLHGGVTMALLDTAMGHAVGAAVIADGRFNVAAQMNVHFLAPVKQGVLTARASVKRLGRRLAVVEAEVTDQDGKLIGIATATHTLLP